MILLINICKEKLHYYEFVKPIEDVLKENSLKYVVKSYLEVDSRDLKKVDRVIICGTSLMDDGFLENVEKFNWLKDFDGKVLGICGGMQMIGLVFGGKLNQAKEIGFFKEKFSREFLGLNDFEEVYHLHNHYVKFGNNFDIFSGDKIVQAVKLKGREIYGVLFHPEVRQKQMIVGFCGLWIVDWDNLY